MPHKITPPTDVACRVRKAGDARGLLSNPWHHRRNAVRKHWSRDSNSISLICSRARRIRFRSSGPKAVVSVVRRRNAATREVRQPVFVVPSKGSRSARTYDRLGSAARIVAVARRATSQELVAVVIGVSFGVLTRAVAVRIVRVGIGDAAPVLSEKVVDIVVGVACQGRIHNLRLKIVRRIKAVPLLVQNCAGR